jgi:hypothetical protein
MLVKKSNRVRVQSMIYKALPTVLRSNRTYFHLSLNYRYIIRRTNMILHIYATRPSNSNVKPGAILKRLLHFAAR